MAAAIIAASASLQMTSQMMRNAQPLYGSPVPQKKPGMSPYIWLIAGLTVVILLGLIIAL